MSFRNILLTLIIALSCFSGWYQMMMFPVCQLSLLAILLVCITKVNSEQRLGSPVHEATNATNALDYEIPLVGRRTASSTFLKMYWQKGYFWQEETAEKKWCMECKDSCSAGNSIWVRKCGRSTSKQSFEIVNGAGGAVQFKVANTNLCMTGVRTRAISLEECSSSTDRQMWVLIAAGSKFEITPFNGSGCVTNNNHHPKDKEVIFVDTCEKARAYKTSYWVKY